METEQIELTKEQTRFFQISESLKFSNRYAALVEENGALKDLCRYLIERYLEDCPQKDSLLSLIDSCPQLKAFHEVIK